MLDQIQNQTFAGIHLSQIWNDLYLWEKTLNQLNPVRIIELGTLYGGMSVFLEVQARVRHAQFYTFDNQSLLKAPHFVSNYYNADIFSEGGRSQIAGLISSPGRSLVYCDNGNKESEAVLFTPNLKEGDILAVHDWGTECSQVPAELTLYTPEDGIYENLRSMTRFFTR